MVIKKLICLVLGHKHSIENDIEELCDDSVTVQECCDRCGCLLKYYTEYGMNGEVNIHYQKK